MDLVHFEKYCDLGKDLFYSQTSSKIILYFTLIILIKSANWLMFSLKTLYPN